MSLPPTFKSCVCKYGTSDGHGESEAHDTGQRGRRSQHAHASHEGRVVQEVAHCSNVGRHQTRVQGVATGKEQSVRLQNTYSHKKNKTLDAREKHHSIYMILNLSSGYLYIVFAKSFSL